MLYIFDATEKLIETLPKGSFFNAIHREVLNGENTFQFTIPVGNEYVVEGNLVAFRDLDSYWQVFEIKRIVDVHGDGLTRTAYCEHIFYELLDDIVTDKRPSADATAALAGMLENTRWQVGIVDDLGASSTNAYYESALSGVQKVAEAWKGELNWRCVISGGVITRYVDLLAMRGADTGKQFAYSKDILNIEREVDSSGVVTALYGRGKGVETESGAYGRRLTFADVEAPGKPLGQEWIGDNDALARWGRPGGRHRFDVFIDEEETDPVKLLEKTKAELDRRKVPRVTYRLDVVSLEELTGYEHEKVRLGDMVRVIDREFTPELVVSARVVEIERDLLDPANTKVVLGSFAPTIVEATININRRVNEMVNRPFNTKWLDGKINVLQNAIENTQSYVFQTGEDGILILDAPTYEQAAKAMKLGGGIFAIANQKDGNGGWNWRTFGDGSGFTADLITAGMIDAGLVQIGPETTFAPGYDPTLIDPSASATMGVDADCVGLWHFDGSLNSHKGVSATFTRASVAYLEDGTEVEAGQPRFEQGKFGQAVKVEEGTTNYLNGASDIASPFVGGTLVTKPEVVSPCGDVVIEWTAGRDDDYTNFKGAVSCSAGEKVTVSIWARKISSSAHCEFYFSHDGTYSNFGFFPTLEWQRYSFTVTCTGTTTVSTRLDNNIQGDIVQFSGWQLEKKPYPTSFVDGTRSPETLIIPTAGVIDTQKGTIAMWVKMGKNGSPGPSGVHDNYISLNAGIWAVCQTNGVSNVLSFIVGDSWGNHVVTGVNISWDKGDWLYIVPKWDLPDISLTVYNFTKGTTATATATGATYTATPTLAHVNCGDGYQFSGYTNSIIDELRIDKIARTDEEIAGWYKANAPFYTSEDMKQWPGYVKVETDGLKVYDSSDDLRVLVGSWLKDAVRKYGIKIIDGEIYSSLIRSGAEDADTYIQFKPPNSLEVYYGGYLQMLIEAVSGGRITFYNNGTMIGRLSGAYSGADLGIIGIGTGKVVIGGNLDVEGTISAYSKSNIEYTDNYGGVYLVVRESPEHRYIDEGMGVLNEGTCKVDIDPVFLECIEPHTRKNKWYIQLTAYGDVDIYVAEIGLDYFIVKEKNNGINTGAEFTWSLSATRKNYANIRFLGVID